MDKFFHPNSVAVFGASDKPMNLANGVLLNLQMFKWPGKVWAIGSRECEVLGHKVRTSVLEIEEPIDLAVVLAPSRAVPAILEDCAKKGIDRVIIEAGGFDEFEGGAALADEVRRIADRHGIRFIGPNCIGTMNAFDKMVLHFSPQQEILGPGPIGVIAQSGGIAMWLIHLIWRSGFGYGLAAAVGNKLNVDETDLLAQYLKEEKLDTVLMYLESVGRGREFFETAKRADKPVIVFKANRSERSGAIAASHTAALANDDAVVSAAMRQAAVWRAETANELANALAGLSMKPCRGDRLMIIARSGGHAVMLVDAAERYGFELVPPPESFRKALDELIPVTRINRQNPLDIGDVFNLEVYGRIVEEASKMEEIDALVFFHTVGSSLIEGDGQGLMKPFGDLARQADKPLALGLLPQGMDLAPIRRDIGYPVFETPDDLMEGLAINRDYHRLVEARDRKRVAAQYPVDSASVAQRLGSMANRSALDAFASLGALESYGVSIPSMEMAKTPQQAGEWVEGTGAPCAIKLVSPQALHKSDIGGVRLGIADRQEAIEAAQEMKAGLLKIDPNAEIDGWLVQRMEPEGVEMIVGARRDPSFGPMVLVGAGGVYVEAFKQSELRVWPIDRLDALEMIQRLEIASILRGVRGEAPRDIEALADILLRVGRMMEDHPEIAEIDLNPVRVYPEGAIALDCRILRSEG